LVKDKKHFVSARKRFLIIPSFYSINEFLDYEDSINIDDYNNNTSALFVYLTYCLLTSDYLCNNVFIVLCLVSYSNAIWQTERSTKRIQDYA
jgi:hypothetical protein